MRLRAHRCFFRKALTAVDFFTAKKFASPTLSEKKQLGNTINGELSGSEDIAEVIGDIKREGYDVYLMLEATIGFSKRAEEPDFSEIPAGEPPDLDFSVQDQDFLKAFKITPDD